MKKSLLIILVSLMPITLYAGHPWQDVMVTPGGSNTPKAITRLFIVNDPTPQDTSRPFDCVVMVDTQQYLRAVDYYGGNRGVILIIKDKKDSSLDDSLYCYMRPFSVKGDTSTFCISIPREMLGKAYIAYIPEQGDTRYLFSLAEYMNYQAKQKQKEPEKQNK